MKDYNEKIQNLADMIKESGKTVFFGGAGVSTESGVKDYRSEDGLYNTVKEYRVSPETILSASFFRSNPEVFFDFYYKYFIKDEVEPNRAHYALAEMEKRGLLSSVITQNIDNLHQKAGSRNVLELHGTAMKNNCVNCGYKVPLEYIKELKGAVPRCPKCGGTVKPLVTLYEEALDEKVTNRAVREITQADTLIIGGTSLAVYPAAMYIRYFGGENLVLVNREPTQYDGMATLIFRESVGQVLEDTVKLL